MGGLQQIQLAGVSHRLRAAGSRSAAVDFCLRHAETRVLDAERLKDALAEEGFQRLACDARDQNAKDVGTAVVHPFLAWLMRQQQAAEAPQQLVGRNGREVCTGGRSPLRTSQ